MPFSFQWWLLTALAVLVGCRSVPDTPAPEVGQPPAPTTQVFQVRGVVKEIRSQGRTLLIRHEEIPDYMDAMTMPFTLNEEWVFDVLTVGSTIQATLVVDGGKSWGKLADLKVSVAGKDGAAATLRAAAAEDVTHVRWIFAKPIAPGAEGTISYRGMVK